MKTGFEVWALLAGWLGMLSMSAWMITDFVRAFFSPAQLISVNRFGEAKAEFALLLAFIPFMAFFALDSFKKIMMKERWCING